MTDLDQCPSIRPKNGVVVVPVEDLLSLLNELADVREKLHLLRNPPQPSYGSLPPGSRVFIQETTLDNQTKYNVCTEGFFDLWFNSFDSREEAEQEVRRNGWEYGVASADITDFCSSAPQYR